MHADAHFVIGQAHVTGGKPCQDYAAAGDLSRGGAYAVISDGCSSGGRTDVGARIVTLATEYELKLALPPAATINEITAAVSTRQRQTFQLSNPLFGLTNSDLLATCGYILVDRKRRFVHLQGDGIIAYRLPDGRLYCGQIEWVDNMPAYPAYQHDNFEQFNAYHGSDLSASKATLVWWAEGREGWEAIAANDLTLAEAERGTTIHLPDGVTQVALFTDGVTQIQGLDWQQAVWELMTFKTTAGAFVKRRLGRFVRDAAKNGWSTLDDLAYAVIDLQPSPDD
jgi:hypothetical protein